MVKEAKNIRSSIRWTIISIVVLFLLAGAYSFPTYYNRAVEGLNAKTGISIPLFAENDFHFGLDLQGGVHLVYDTDTTQIPVAERESAVEGVRDVIERRVNTLGVSEPLVQTNRSGEKFRIIAELPGVANVAEALKVIGETPILDFRERNDEPPRELTEEEQKEMDEFNEKAEERATGLLTDDTDFAELARNISEDFSTREQGGSLGFVLPNQFPEFYEWAQGKEVGEKTKELIETSEGWNILLVNDKKESLEPLVSARHILICHNESTQCANELTKEESLEKIQGIKNRANSNNFEELAKEFSEEPFSEERGGDLGWFAKGTMVPEFEEAVFNMPVGDISDPIETPFGYHIILKTNEAKEEIALSRILIGNRVPTDIVPPQEEWKTTGLTGSALKNARVNFDQYTGAAEVIVEFDSEGKDMFAEITKRSIGLPIAIFLDGTPISIPTVQTEISGGEAVISGNFSVDEARVLTQRLNAGALPVPVELVSQQAVGASLGQESLQKSLLAGLVGSLVVIIFMILYYRLPGILASTALVIYAALVLALFKLIPVTLTLAGIAGFIVSIGMAVDANVLIFERMKEELEEGKSLKGSINEGFNRAWTSIRDSNISTLITCVLLYWFGTSIVRGFAITLAVGVLVSMFSAIVITKALLRFVEPWFASKARWLFLGGGKKSREQKDN